MSAALVLRARPGIPVQLGREIARGGEGAIHELPSKPGWVAKMYVAPPTLEKATKLRAMVTLPATRIPTSTAWPLDVLETGDVVRGLVMPRINGCHDLHMLWSGASRRTLFPTATYTTLVAVAANLARAVAGVHEAGHVIGDINERCAMVRQDAVITLIDCDSFQFDTERRHYGCDVGTPMYQPPELQRETSFRNLERTRNHDAFGLALLVFQLLFFARHPFAGRPVSGDAPEIPEAIRDYRFAWTGDQGILQPPKTLSLPDVGPALEFYFRRAFGSEGATKGRPRPAAWAKALDEFRAALKPCTVNPAHQHLGRECPLCRVEAEMGGDLFALSSTARPVYDPEQDMRALWVAIEAQAPPNVRPSAPEPSAYVRAVSARPYLPPPERGWFGSALQSIGFLDPLDDLEHRQRQTAMVDTKAAYARLAVSWRTHNTQMRFTQAKLALAATKSSVEGAFQRRALMILELTHRNDLKRHLEISTIASAGIQGIGPKRLDTLHAYAITTAADVSRRDLMALPGFGPKLVGLLLAWRDERARNFRTALKGAKLDVAAVRKIDGELAPEINRGLTLLRSGAATLNNIVAEENRTTSAALRNVEIAALQAAKAKADFYAPR